MAISFLCKLLKASIGQSQDSHIEIVDAQTAEMLLRANGFKNEELKTIGFDVEVE